MKKLFTIIAVFISTHTLTAQQLDYPDSCIYRNEAIENSPEYLTGNEYQKDFLLFIHMLENTHPAFVEKSRYPIDIDSIRTDVYVQLASCDSEYEMSTTLQKIITPIRDGHTYAKCTGKPKPQKSFLVNAHYRDGKFYISAVDKQYQHILGKEIASINGFPMDEVMDRIYANTVYENKYELYKHINVQLPNCLLMADHGLCDPEGTLTIVSEEGETVVFSPDTFEREKFAIMKTPPPSGITAFNGRPFSYQIIDSLDVCYMQFNTFDDYNCMLYRIRQRISDPEERAKKEKELAESPNRPDKFDEFLEKMFTEIQETGIGNLVVDVRNNVGGNSALGDQLLSYIKPYGAMKRGHVLIRFSGLFEQLYPVYYEFYKSHVKKGKELSHFRLYFHDDFKQKRDKKSNGADYPFKINQSPRKYFHGNVYFIQGWGTYSSAGDLLIAAQDNNIGIIVGERGTYRPCNYGDILMWKLPNTGVHGGVSHKYFTRPDMSRCGEESLIPDVEIRMTREDAIADIDPYWQWIVKDTQETASRPK